MSACRRSEGADKALQFLVPFIPPERAYHSTDLCTKGEFSSSRSDGVNLAAGLLSLKIDHNKWPLSGAPASSRAVSWLLTCPQGRGRTAGCAYFSKTINARLNSSRRYATQ